jgi:cell wall-active antibiotic response 4TMS protein YvqF
VSGRRGLLWPLILITIGIVFLLANFGYIGRFSVIALLNLWPLILVLVGIDIAFGRRWPLATLVADVAIIGAGLAFVATQPNLPSPFFVDSSAGGGESMLSVPRTPSTTGMRLRLAGGAGTFNVHGAGLSDEAVHATSDRGDLRLRGNTRIGDRADVRIDQVGFEGIHFGPSSPAHVDYAIANDIPTSLQFDSGAGEFTLDLTDVKLTDANVNVGAASLRIMLPKPTGDVAISISAGASSIVVEVPAGVEARVTTSGGLLTTHFDSSRFASGETSGYASAKDRVTVRFTGGVSSVTVR